ncbi:MAG: ABC transporter permease [Anaeromicrobium sp.]|jgi:simple sugar transport system permease protein|uniref:ABC transporter permease n=1 Tax=Anaeromicrobium sp. TaxID=1929132 RepID=UPI0025ED9C01|nr:ABC transporter permease [Anaeromicrobium sp.]MCT4595259.1 ABC transporter permease [Anaeromicrobium sp.]
MNRLKNSINKFDALRTSLAILIALSISTIIIFFTSETPIYSLQNFLFGPLQRLKYFSYVLEMMIPLICTGLGLSIIYQSKNFSLIADGCFYMGSIIAAFVGIKFAAPMGIHPLIGMACAGLVGGTIGMLPGIIKIKWKANELVTSLMFNYIFYFFGLYIVNYYLRDPKASVFASYKFKKSFGLPRILPGTRLHFGFVIAIAFIVLVYIYLYKTKWGYEIRTVGDNLNFARYSGINTAKVIICSQFIAGSIAGMGGAIEMSGMYKRFLWDVPPSYAWDGVIVALLSRNNPKYVPLAAFFLSYLRIGADMMSRRADVDNEIIAIIQAVMILLIAAERFLAFWKQRQEDKKAKEKYLNENVEVA